MIIILFIIIIIIAWRVIESSFDSSSAIQSFADDFHSNQ